MYAAMMGPVVSRGVKGGRFVRKPQILRHHKLVSVFIGALLFLVATFATKPAAAYPWMIRHEYSACATCHTDPSGGALLTRYGRAQAALLLSSRLGLPDAEEEPGKYKDFLFGAFELPEELDMQAWLRSGYMANMSNGKVVDKRVLFMRGDVGAHVRSGMFRASGMLGVMAPIGNDGIQAAQAQSHEAWITGNGSGANLVSREHWAGLSLSDDALLLRAGRLNIPFGLRNIEHTTWVRRETHTDTNQQQQHGISLAYTGEKLRGELMAVAGNFQIRPDAYRERGYAGYLEYAVIPSAAVGLSSQVLHANADTATRQPYFRHSHGIFGRIAPVKPLVLMAEGDVLVSSPKSDNPATDFTGLFQADFEATQGLHFVGTAEMLTQSKLHQTLVGGWLGAWFFLFAHMDARFDVLQRTAGTAPSTTTVLFQLHGWF